MASAAILAALLAHAKEVEVRVTGKARLTVRITDDGRKTGRSKTLSVALALARACGYLSLLRQDRVQLFQSFMPSTFY
ncbi:MAG: hypothetical protein WDO18_04155 [Acidobacteriota bacterium]